MRIGIDFDNTLANYFGVFYDVAVSEGLISQNQTNPIQSPCSASKAAVKTFVINTHGEDAWTQLQGIVYGREITRASLFEGSLGFLETMSQRGNECFIVSHKTHFPVIGERYSLHEAAKKWLWQRGVFPDLVAESAAFLEVSQDKKLERIRSLDLDVFIDDLPPFLEKCLALNGLHTILFDPNDEYSVAGAVFSARCVTWRDIMEVVDGVK